MIPLKKYFIALSLVIISSSCLAQSSHPITNLISLGLTSPEVASLGKFGDIPVSYSTGVPQISIPIFEIKVGDIHLPISLDYHAGGIRVDEISSSVGTGWALNAGGSVYRQMVGLPDETSGGYLSSPPFDQVYANESTYYTYLYNVMEGLSDASPDVFSYNAGGRNAKFIIKKSDLSFIQFPLTNNKIENYTGTTYKITTPQGVGYIYEQKENTSFGMVNQVNLVPAYTSAWRLTKIVSSNQVDTVFITYDLVQALGRHERSFTHTIGTAASTAYGASGPGDPINDDNYVSQVVYNDEAYVKQIDWKGGRLTFTNAQDRLDYPSSKRVQEVDIYSKMNGAYTLLRKVKLNQSYFYYVPSGYSDSQDLTGADPYRLRLDSVQFYDANGTLKPQTYKMTYDNTPMAPRESYGQDYFGFNNGHFTNTTLMQTQTVLFNQVGTGNSYFTFGNANRDCDPNYIKACSIQSMTYPTGGKTVYQLEPHSYNTQTNQVVTQSVESVSEGDLRSSNSVSFVLTSSMSNLRYTLNISSYNYPGQVSNYPNATLTDQTTGQTILSFTNMNANQSLVYGLTPVSNNTGPYLTVGHTYVLTTNIYTTNANVKATFDVYWDTQTTVPLVLQGGGLRVKSITNYDNNGNWIDQKSYSYTDDGTGTLLTPQQYLSIMTNNTYFRRGNQDPSQGGQGSSCMYSTGRLSVIYNSNTVVPVSQFTGSPVLYNKITEYETSSTGSNSNGKKVFGYPIYQDQQVLANNVYTYGVQMVSNEWQNGYMSSEDIYKSNSSSGYNLVESKRYNYVNTRLSTEQMIRVKPTYTYSFDVTSCEQFNASFVGQDIVLDSYNLPTGAILLQSETDTVYDNAGNKTGTLHNYYYDDATHLFATRNETFNSKGDDLIDVIKYPHDFVATGNVYQTMLNRNMIAPPISYQQTKNSNQLTLTTINYKDWYNNGKLLLPQTVSKQVLSNTAETLINFDNYDNYGNILQQEKTLAPPAAYQWGYSNLYPVAQATNATSNDIFYDSFEEGDGTSINGDSKTGHYSYNSSTTYSKPLSGLSGGTYTLSYWLKSGGSWSYVVNTNVQVTGSTYTISLSGQIDDVRFYPTKAQMTTYTYDPLIGMTSKADAKGETTYYEYDTFQRLLNIKDKDGNIIKSYTYHYQGQ